MPLSHTQSTGGSQADCGYEHVHVGQFKNDSGSSVTDCAYLGEEVYLTAMLVQ